MKKLVSILLGSVLVFAAQAFLFAKVAMAIDIPHFPACVNPEGLKIVDIRGTHGVAGDTTTYTGVDKVYLVNGKEQVTQCLCLDDGRGIQTNWWKISSLNEDQIKILKSEGWVYVPNGNAWGLLEGPYMAQNAGFSCNGSSNGGGPSSSTSSNPIGQVLGLAFTGNILVIYAFLFLGATSILTALFLNRNK